MDLLPLAAPSEGDEQQAAAFETLAPHSTPFPLRAPHRFSHGPSPLSRSAREEGCFSAAAQLSSPPPTLGYLHRFQPTTPDWWKELYMPLPGCETIMRPNCSPFSAFFALANLCARSTHPPYMDLRVHFPTIDNGYDDERGRFVDDEQVDRMELDGDYPISYDAEPSPLRSFNEPCEAVLERREKNHQGGVWLCQRRWELLHSLTPKLLDHIQGMVERKTRGGLSDADVRILVSYQSLPAGLRAALDPEMDIYRLVRILNTTLGGVLDQGTEQGRVGFSASHNVPSTILPPLGEIGNQAKFRRERRISFSKTYNLPALNAVGGQCRPLQSPRARDTSEYEAERDLTCRWFNSMTSRRDPIDMRKQAIALRWKRSIWNWDDFALYVS